MIITLTGNLLAERTLTFSDWNAGKTQRAASEVFQVGGKGINVTKMLRRLEHPAAAWFFAGGASGAECEAWLGRTGLPHRAFRTVAPTRTGVVIRSREQPETTFLAPDRMADPQALVAMAHAVSELSAEQPNALFALCGSFPGWSEEEARPLREALAECARKGQFVADTYGPPLHWMTSQPVALVKINRLEFDDLFDADEKPLPVSDRISLALQRWPVQAWVVTDGAEEVCYGDATTKPASIRPPRVQEISPTGSGDVFFACLLHAIRTLKVGLAQGIEYAMPYGAANAADPGVAEFDLNLLPTGRSVSP